MITQTLPNSHRWQKFVHNSHTWIRTLLSNIYNGKHGWMKQVAWPHAMNPTQMCVLTQVSTQLFSYLVLGLIWHTKDTNTQSVWLLQEGPKQSVCLCFVYAFMCILTRNELASKTKLSHSNLDHKRVKSDFHVCCMPPCTTSLTSSSDITDRRGSDARDEPRDGEVGERKRGPST